MRTLVTGGAGYVGYAVARRLTAAGHETIGLVRRTEQMEQLPPGTRAAVADLLDRAALRAALAEMGPVDGVCHLAALTRVRESFKDPLSFFATNVQGTVNLLQVLGELQPGGPPVRCVLGSTAAVYGASKRGPAAAPIEEDRPTAPTSPYGASKLAAEQVVGYHAATGAVGAVVLRTFNVAGAVDGRADPDRTRLIPKALLVAAGQVAQLEMNGDGSAVREFVHVDDLAAAYVLGLEACRPGEHRVFNVGSGRGTSVSEVVATVEQVTGRRVTVVHKPPQPEPATLIADSSAIRAELGWQPVRSDLAQVVADSWSSMRAG